MARTNQGGSILGFAVVGAVLAVLLIGGVYIVRHALTPAEVVVIDEDQSENSDTDDMWEPKEGEIQTEDNQTDNQSGADSQSERSSPETLPETGPADLILSGLMLSTIIAAAVAYGRSTSL